MLASSSIINNEEWFFDTCATHHRSQTATSLDDIQSYKGSDEVTIGNAPVPPSPDPCVSTLALLPISSSLSTLPSYPLTSSSLPATWSPTSTQPAPDLIQVPSDGNL
ncbi:hypothetical protein CK203_059826 [Vitis vinifera]|uniref:Uncharacterized protein n=1 Tax=Vitis vinifera TaxID=29760 RepID=A0A438GG30_VITVI|nr:hypothetical protein CK203_059826 [Vitis vinifera]